MNTYRIFRRHFDQSFYWCLASLTEVGTAKVIFRLVCRQLLSQLGQVGPRKVAVELLFITTGGFVRPYRCSVNAPG
jgi:hypothetical protein